MDDLRQHADYLDQLAKARVPVLWRPLHEIEGGWFWWSDTKTPENTARLWRMMFDYQSGDHGEGRATLAILLAVIRGQGPEMESAGLDQEGLRA